MGEEKAKIGNGFAEGSFRSRMDHYFYSGDKKHVMAGIAILTVIFCVPWFLTNRGTKHQSHQDYMERANKARGERLSSDSSSK